MTAKMKKVLVIGSGPIVIGQSAEFDYSGTQACRTLREEGIEVVLANSNPATIQTDKDIADRIYIEPLTVEVIERIIEKERPEGILATVGGQSALNLAMELKKGGILEKYNVKFLGTDADSIERCESREEFNKMMRQANIPILPGEVVHDFETARKFAEKNGYPVIIRPSFTLGGTGGGVAYNEEQLKDILELAFRLSMTSEALVEQSVIGWGEFEYEVVRDADGNMIIICNMENFDPMGIHTGDSIVVAPSQTLSDQDHQKLRNAAFRIVDAAGIKGSCNVQFSFNQATGEFAVIEINPRLSRSSALASKATGYPIARIATKIALGYKLHEIKNQITGTSAAFEPALDYVVTKIPRWPFDKFSRSDRKLGTQMKSTGEAMAIGRTFEESLMKALRSLDVKVPVAIQIDRHIYPATDLRIYALFQAFRKGYTVEELHERTKINTWFLRRIKRIVEIEQKVSGREITKEIMLEAKAAGIADKKIAELKGSTELEIRKLRKELGVLPVFKAVDSCAGEFEAITPYYYSTYGVENEAKPTKDKKKVIVLGSGPIRIGQGIEFDYCCSHAAFALKDMGVMSIMINNNPETVSTDFDSSDRLYFEPLVFEDVMNIVENEQPDGIIVQLGGQTSINLAESLHNAGANILGTPVESIDTAEDREKFRQLANKLGVPQPKNATVTSSEKAHEVANMVGYPVVIRPSYVIAGRGMDIVRDDNELTAFLVEAMEATEDKPLLVDKYLDDAIECEVDGVADGNELFIGGIMEHIEPAGVHSGDANIVLPPVQLTKAQQEKIAEHSRSFVKALKIKGIVNIQYAVKDGIVYILEVNPRASRTVPFLSKATGVQLAKLATHIMLGEKLEPQKKKKTSSFAVKSVVFPFLKLGGDIRLGPEMRSTGETMGIGSNFETAYYKALIAAGLKVKTKAAFLSLRDEDKKLMPKIAELLDKLGFEIYGTAGTIEGIKNAKIVHKIMKGHPDVLEIIQSGKIGLLINTPRRGGSSSTDGFKIRRLATEKGVPCITNINTAFELLKALHKLQKNELEIKELSEY
ncbi:MAG: carbamoyl-phosphate synthase large subunit [Candidatus Micrarchaeota archaeon]